MSAIVGVLGAILAIIAGSALVLGLSEMTQDALGWSREAALYRSGLAVMLAIFVGGWVIHRQR